MAILASSCAFIRLKEDLNNMAAHRGVHGAISATKHPSEPIILIAYDEKQKPVAFKKVAPNTDYYLFNLPKNRNFTIAAFEDKNENSKYDKGEPALIAETSGGNSPSETLNIHLSPKNAIPATLKTNIDEMPDDIGEKNTIAIGTITTLDNPLFDEKHASEGLWTPHQFLSKYGLGVYFLETYDPAKTPILFVYGIKGFPRAWKTFIDKIDHSKFQAWIYFYPTGYSIPSSGKALDIVMSQIQDKFKLKKLFIVAHSMGGLVAKEYIRRAIGKKNDSHIKLLITLATPWGGDKDAEWGTKAPATVPAWNDIVPSSEFIKNTSPKDIGDRIPFYLFFSFKGDRKPFRFNNDNVITLRSALRWNMERRATKVYGFDTAHADILRFPETIETCNEIFKRY